MDGCWATGQRWKHVRKVWIDGGLGACWEVMWTFVARQRLPMAAAWDLYCSWPRAAPLLAMLQDYAECLHTPQNLGETCLGNYQAMFWSLFPLAI